MQAAPWTRWRNRNAHARRAAPTFDEAPESPIAWEQRHLDVGQRLVAEAVPGARRAGDPAVFRDLDGLPEIAAADLTPQFIADALASKGALVARSLLSSDAIVALREQIDANHRHVEELLAGPDQISNIELSMMKQTVPAAALQVVIAAYRAVGFTDLLEAHFGERPVLSRDRLALARREGTGLPWHQDAAFWGRNAAALNAWTALTPIGDEVPGLEIVPRRMDRIVALENREAELEDDPAPLNYNAGNEGAAIAAVLEETPPFAPVLQPGDSLLFDEMTLHRTQLGSARREYLVAWAFAPSRFRGKTLVDGRPFAL